MPDEIVYPDQPAPQQSEAPSPGPTPDFTQFTQAIQQTIREGLAERPAPAQQPAPPAQQPVYRPSLQVQQPQAQQDPLRDLLAPYLREMVGPALTYTHLQAQSAQDMATFYRSVPDAQEFGDQIEHLHQQSMEMARQGQGQPIARMAIWNYLKGGPLFDQMVERSIQTKSQAQARAVSAQSVGPGIARGSQSAALPSNARDMTDEQLESALSNVRF